MRGGGLRTRKNRGEVNRRSADRQAMTTAVVAEAANMPVIHAGRHRPERASLSAAGRPNNQAGGQVGIVSRRTGTSSPVKNFSRPRSRPSARVGSPEFQRRFNRFSAPRSRHFSVSGACPMRSRCARRCLTSVPVQPESSPCRGSRSPVKAGRRRAVECACGRGRRGHAPGRTARGAETDQHLATSPLPSTPPKLPSHRLVANRLRCQNGY